MSQKAKDTVWFAATVFLVTLTVSVAVATIYGMSLGLSPRWIIDEAGIAGLEDILKMFKIFAFLLFATGMAAAVFYNAYMLQDRGYNISRWRWGIGTFIGTLICPFVPLLYLIKRSYMLHGRRAP